MLRTIYQTSDMNSSAGGAPIGGVPSDYNSTMKAAMDLSHMNFQLQPEQMGAAGGTSRISDVMEYTRRSSGYNNPV